MPKPEPFDWDSWYSVLHEAMSVALATDPDPSTPAGRMVLRLAEAMEEYEQATISEGGHHA